MKKSNFSHNLKTLRKQYSMSMEELGNHINVSKQTISKYEKGIMEPNFHTLVSISNVFDCSLDDLAFGDIEKNKSNPSLFSIKNLIDIEFSNLKEELNQNLKEELNQNFKKELNQDIKKELYTFLQKELYFFMQEKLDVFLQQKLDDYINNNLNIAFNFGISKTKSQIFDSIENLYKNELTKLKD